METSGQALAAYLKPRENGEPKDKPPSEIGEVIKTFSAVAEYWLSDKDRAAELQTKMGKAYLDLWGVAARRMLSIRATVSFAASSGRQRMTRSTSSISAFLAAGSLRLSSEIVFTVTSLWSFSRSLMPSPVVPEPPSTKTVAGFLAAPEVGALVVSVRLMKTEYRSAFYNAKTQTELLDAGNVPLVNSIRANSWNQTVSTSLVYRFNWTGPVVAKY